MKIYKKITVGLLQSHINGAIELSVANKRTRRAMTILATAVIAAIAYGAIIVWLDMRSLRQLHEIIHNQGDRQ